MHNTLRCTDKDKQHPRQNKILVYSEENMDGASVGLTIDELNDVLKESKVTANGGEILDAAIAIQKKLLKKLQKAKIIHSRPVGRPRKILSPRQGNSLDLLISQEDYDDLARFSLCKSFRLVNEVSIYRMECMANLGLVRKLRGHYFEITGIGKAVLNGDIAVFSGNEIKKMVQTLGAQDASQVASARSEDKIEKVLAVLEKKSPPTHKDKNLKRA